MPSIHSSDTPSSFRCSDTHTAISTSFVNSTSKSEQRNADEQTNTITNRWSHPTSSLIRDEIQSHNDDSSTNLREKPSVFASVSPFPCPNEQRERGFEEQQTSTTCTTDNEKSFLQATSTNSTNIHPATGDASSETSAAATSLKQSRTEVGSSSLSTPKQIHVPAMTSSCNTIPVFSSYGKKVKKRKRVPNDSTAMNMNGTFDDSTAELTTNASLSYSRSGTTGRWTAQEHQAFVRGLSLYGREWKRVALDIPTRTSAQVRSHAQKYLSKMEKQLSLVHDTDNVHLPLDNSTDSETPALFKSSNVQSYNDFTITNDQSPTTSHERTNCQDSETNTYEDGSPTGSHQQDTENDYQTMSDSVRQQAARILANPTTVEQEVRDTITQLRARYQQLQDRIQQQQQHLQEQGTQPHARTTTSRTNDGNNEQNLNVVLHGPLYSDQEQGDSIRNSDNKSSGNIGDEVGSKISSTVGGMDQRNTNNNSSASTTVVAQRILYVHHDDDELIALHVLQGLQKQQLRI